MFKNILLWSVAICLCACRKESFTTDAAVRLYFNADTIQFDTVFANTGSVTQQLKIFNNADKGIRITSVRLLGGAASAFQINSNGVPGPDVNDQEIAARDSAYLFVTVRPPATSATTPFVLRDSVEFLYNGNRKLIQLRAAGQNAHFLNHYSITGDEHWTADLPYVVQDSLVVAEGAHLTLEAGCRVYFHANAPLLVSGQLTIKGERWDSTRVVLTGDRLDAPYRDLPGSWPGLIFKSSSHDNNIEYGVLKNAVQAISVQEGSDLTLNQTIVDNTSDAGIIAQHATITAQNLVVQNCGRSVVLEGGGSYQFRHATVAAFSTSFLPHKSPVLVVGNAVSGSIPHDLDALFQNCIFWGAGGYPVPDELVLNKTGTTLFSVVFDGVLWPLAAVPDGATVTVPPLQQDPEFETVDQSENQFDFHLKESSPARNSGVASAVSLDLDGRPRPVGEPDLGAYEEQ